MQSSAKAPTNLDWENRNKFSYVIYSPRIGRVSYRALVHPTIKELSQFRELDCLWEIHYSFESLAEFIGHKSNTFKEFAEWGPARVLLLICFKEATPVLLKTSKLASEDTAVVYKLKRYKNF